MLSLNNVGKVYNTDSKDAVQVVALNGINAEFDSVGFVAVVGKSGSGKTTLLNILGGIETPTSGQVMYNGENIFDKNFDTDMYRCGEIGLVFQDYNLLSDYSVAENIQLACRLQGLSNAEATKRTLDAMKDVGIEELAARKISKISGGQQQRVAIARALAKNSKILLCDEPTGNLDSQTADEIFALLKRVSLNRAVIVVTHDRELACKYADRTVELSDGSVVGDATNSPVAQSDNSVQNAVRAKVGIRPRDSFKIICNNIKHSVFINIVITLLLTVTVALTTVFASLGAYNSIDAFAETLKQNNGYVLPLVKYADVARTEWNVDTGEKYTIHGPQITDDVVADDLQNLIAAAHGNSDIIAKAVIFKKNFQDFTADFIDQTPQQNVFYADSFSEIIAVDNFDKFGLPLLYGSLPRGSDEVLLYDYSVSSLIHYGLLQGNLANAVGQTLTDADTGLTLKISGILASDYEKYRYIEQGNKDYSIEKRFIASLRTIFALPDLAEKLAAESDYVSVYQCQFVQSDQQGERRIDANVKKLKYIDSEDCEFVFLQQDIPASGGIIADKQTVARLYGIQPSDVTADIAADFVNSVAVAGTVNYDTGRQTEFAFGFDFPVIGVADNDLANVLCLFTPNKDALFTNLQYGGYYLLLGDDWRTNRQILEDFAMKKQSDEFYAANPDYSYCGYTYYSPFGTLINDADDYLVKVKNFAKTITYILIGASVVGVFFYATQMIKKYGYNIGVLKALGAKNGDMVSVFGLQVLMVMFAAFVISVPLSYVLMAHVNATFAANLPLAPTFFVLSPITPIIAFAVSFAVVAVAVSLPFVKFYKQPPITTIRNNKR